MRLGGVDTIKVDVRIIAANKRRLQKMVADGRFARISIPAPRHFRAASTAAGPPRRRAAAGPAFSRE